MTDWKRKLAAYLHDPPSKALDIASHEEFARTLYRQAGFIENEVLQFVKAADRTASAADRFPFPDGRTLSCRFNGVRNAFHHPLGPGKNFAKALTLPFSRPFATADLARETDQSVQPTVDDFGSLPDDEFDPNGARWRARFFAHWRLWQKFATERDYRFGFLPADTRLPDHTVWTHMQVVSALENCAEGEGKDGVIKTAFLKLQIGPVQDFIAQARSTRDLWSGSYLLSWLMAAGLKALSALVGPDAVIFPSLRNQPLFDLQWRDELWGELRMHKDAKNAWETLAHQSTDLLTPNLPNVLLALVPSATATDLANRVEMAIRDEWRQIADACWRLCEKAGMTANEPGISARSRQERFNAQVEQFLSISWQVTPWAETLAEALKLTASLPVFEARRRVSAVVKAATETMPKEHRDGRYYQDEQKTVLNNLGLAWSLLCDVNRWALDAVRQTRMFKARTSGGWASGVFNNKDSLNGRDEAVAGGPQWQQLATAKGSYWKSLFKKDDWLGAISLIKRLWHVAYLMPNWDLKADAHNFPMPNTRGIAAHEPFSDTDEEPDTEESSSSEKYFAVLAFDGDEIGKWVSGDKTPPFKWQLADYTDENGQSKGAVSYFKEQLSELMDLPRPVSPSYHLQFSEALTNFALRCVRPVVEVFDGCLIYSGGDDVLALLPADTALACAQALRMAFQGSPELGSFLADRAKALQGAHLQNNRKIPRYQAIAAEARLLGTIESGFLSRLDRVDTEGGRAIPFIVPGPAADASIGVAIAHFKSPLQDVVRAAQAAEKRAKAQLSRSAVAVTLCKRSGEIIEWGCKWDDGGLKLYNEIASALRNDELSAKFPYRLVELLSPYLVEASPLAGKSMRDVNGFPVDDVIRAEFSNTLDRQRGANSPKLTDLSERILPKVVAYLESLDHIGGSDRIQHKIRSVLGLCQTVAFANRTDK